jgi:hypothetical protein
MWFSITQQPDSLPHPTQCQILPYSAVASEKEEKEDGRFASKGNCLSSCAIVGSRLRRLNQSGLAEDAMALMVAFRPSRRFLLLLSLHYSFTTSLSITGETLQGYGSGDYIAYSAPIDQRPGTDRFRAKSVRSLVKKGGTPDRSRPLVLLRVNTSKAREADLTTRFCPTNRGSRAPCASLPPAVDA